jgi:hypothetical protein
MRNYMRVCFPQVDPQQGSGRPGNVGRPLSQALFALSRNADGMMF